MLEFLFSYKIKGGAKMPSKYQYVHELWLEQSQHITSSPESWMTFLKTASWTYKYRFEDQILIYSQNLTQEPVLILIHGIKR